MQFNDFYVTEEINILKKTLSPYGEIWLVGGCVRDILMGRKTNDFDIATTILPTEVINILKMHHIKVIPTGLDFGTVTAILHHKQFEITTLRKDLICDGRKAVVQFTHDLFEDANRRDFTINALYLSLENNTIIDFFQGVEDIKYKKIKFIGQPLQRINEDALRILRYFRFLAYFGVDTIDHHSLQACHDLAVSLQRLSGERIRCEFLKLLQAPFALQSFNILNQKSLMIHLGLPCEKMHDIAFIESEGLLNLILILRRIQDEAFNLEKFLQRWCFSKHEKKIIFFLYNYHYDLPIEASTKLHKRKKYELQQYFAGALLIKAAETSIQSLKEAQLLLEKSHSWHYPNFPLTGQDLKALGYQGAQIGKILRTCQQLWIQSDFTKNCAELIRAI